MLASLKLSALENIDLNIFFEIYFYSKVVHCFFVLGGTTGAAR